MDSTNCDRCLPKLSLAMGFIPMPAISNNGDDRDDRKIFLCNYHYFEAKKDCYYVVPFNHDDDPVNSFLARINRKHKLVRGSRHLKFKPRHSSNEERSFSEVMGLQSKLLSSRTGKISRNDKHRVHFLEAGRIACGLPLASTVPTEKVEDTTCKNCLALLDF